MRVVVGIDIGEPNMERLRTSFPDVTFTLAADRDRLLEAVTGADVLFAKGVPPETWARSRRLRWYQAGMAGVDGVLPRITHLPELIVTTASGAHGEVISDLILAMMLSFATGLHTIERGGSRAFSAAEREAITQRKFALRGQTAGILGLGDIGGALAAKLKALGVRTVGITRTGERAGLVDVHYHSSELHRALPDLDHLALCLPMTVDTLHIIGAREFEILKSGAYLYNVGRGGAVEPDALLAALESGRLSGAGLDVTDPEPLPDSSWLRSMPRVILTEHTSGSSPANSDLITSIFLENLTRYIAGEPLFNRVDRGRGY